jgi:hypothetical protein
MHGGPKSTGINWEFYKGDERGTLSECAVDAAPVGAETAMVALKLSLSVSFSHILLGFRIEPAPSCLKAGKAWLPTLFKVNDNDYMRSVYNFLLGPDGNVTGAANPLMSLKISR